jgi:hypothetical protein
VTADPPPDEDEGPCLLDHLVGDGPLIISDSFGPEGSTITYPDGTVINYPKLSEEEGAALDALRAAQSLPPLPPPSS